MKASSDNGRPLARFCFRVQGISAGRKKGPSQDLFPCLTVKGSLLLRIKEKELMLWAYIPPLNTGLALPWPFMTAGTATCALTWCGRGDSINTLACRLIVSVLRSMMELSVVLAIQDVVAWLKPSFCQKKRSPALKAWNWSAIMA